MEVESSNRDLLYLQLNSLLLLLLLKKKRLLESKGRRRMWVRSIFSEEKRIDQGPVENLMKELIVSNDIVLFSNYARMSPENWNLLLSKVFPKLEKQNTIMRKPITPAERLCVTIRFLAEGKSQKSLMYEHRHGHSTIVNITSETMDAVIEALRDDYLPKPSTSDFKRHAEHFYYKWNLPHCCGACDGKHVRIIAPPKSGSIYFNYKNFFSIILLAVVDADYKFVYVDIGAPGSASDGGVFSNTDFGKDLENGTLQLPANDSLPNSQVNFPHFIVGDEAFPLKPYIMRPYPGRYLPTDKKIFNYRISRARRVVENAFGILASKWRILHSAINASLEKTNKIVTTVVLLHNYLRSKDSVTNLDSRYLQTGDVDQGDDFSGSWRNDRPVDTWQNIGQLGSNNSSLDAKLLRDQLREYLNGVGAVPWQLQAVSRVE